MASRLGGAALILGSLLFAVYGTLFPLLLPLGESYNRLSLVQSPHWIWLAAVAFAGIVLMMVGFMAAWRRIEATSGALGIAGILLIEAAFLLQACKVTWELLLYPVIASNAASAFLLSDNVIGLDPGVATFRQMAALAIFLGVSSFCVVLYRSGQYPKAAPLLVFGGAVTYAIGAGMSMMVAVAGILILAAGCSLLGWRLVGAPPGN